MKWIFGFLVILFTTPAQADTVTVTFSGTVAPYVWTGSSYALGNPLSGQSFSTVWTVDACQGCSSGILLSAALTVGGQTFAYAVDGYTAAFITFERLYLNTTVVPGEIALNSFVEPSIPFQFSSLTTPFAYQVTAADNGMRPFNLGGSFLNNPGPDGFLTVQSVTLANPAILHNPAPVMGGISSLVWLFKRNK